MKSRSYFPSKVTKIFDKCCGNRDDIMISHLSGYRNLKLW